MDKKKFYKDMADLAQTAMEMGFRGGFLAAQNGPIKWDGDTKLPEGNLIESQLQDFMVLFHGRMIEYLLKTDFPGDES